MVSRYSSVSGIWCLPDRATTYRVTRESMLEFAGHTWERCPECQMHGNLIHVHPFELHALTFPWPFSTWGIDVIRKVSPKSFSGHEYILVAIDYFTKWVEAASYASLTTTKVAKFIRSHIIWAIPFSLVYGMEAVLFVEIEVFHGFLLHLASSIYLFLIEHVLPHSTDRFDPGVLVWREPFGFGCWFLGSLSTSPFPSYSGLLLPVITRSHYAHTILRYVTLRTQRLVVAATFGALSEVQLMHAIYHFKAQEVNNPILQTCCEITLLLRSDFAAFLYSVVDFLLKLPDICDKLEAENLKMEANFAALRE
ncbi:hypothetical protein CK203_054827 [Vitis vinifera]|uniref:Integrase catalytic domain-containing protein n=1 Tax=Vitis vinifera TaxID=29760 RepID=A0A438H3Z3_VITVI|nr:hypothetical protein CK203_054827 [Vitis vinifera]